MKTLLLLGGLVCVLGFSAVSFADCRAGNFNAGAIQLTSCPTCTSGVQHPNTCTPTVFQVTTNDPDNCDDNPNPLYDDIDVTWNWGDTDPNDPHYSPIQTVAKENGGGNNPSVNHIGTVQHQFKKCGDYIVHASVIDEGIFKQDKTTPVNLATFIVHVAGPLLDFDLNKVPDNKKQDPGLIMCQGGDLQELQATVCNGGSVGTISLSVGGSGASNIRIWEDSSKTHQVDTSKGCSSTPPANCYPAPSKIFYIEGVNCSSQMRDITITETYTVDGVSCDDYVTVTVVGFSFLNPYGDPTLSPATGNSEFTFSTANPGILTVPCQLLICPADPEITDSMAGEVVFTIDSIGGSVLSWDNAGGKGVYIAGAFEATATFTGLPSNNSDFGQKVVKATITDPRFNCGSLTQNIQVFYPKNGTNHPNGSDGITVDASGNKTGTINSPNWFYYWKKVVDDGDANLVYAQGSPDPIGATPWIKLWLTYSRLAGASRSMVWISNGASGYAPTLSQTKGIDLFANVILHEQKHVAQISRADALIPSTNTYGWSWNVASSSSDWNHYDSSNNNLDYLPASIGPNDTPDSWSWNTAGGIEAEAKAAQTNPDNNYAAQDWGDPGKRHKHNNQYDD